MKYCTDKSCSNRNILLSFENFNKNRAFSDGYQSICKECSRIKSKAYYHNNHDKHLAETMARKKKQVAKCQAYILDYWKEHPCVDCGETHTACLEFDHIKEGKTKNLSSMVQEGYSLERIIQEISLCEVRCANCHRKRTAQTQNWYSKGD